MRIFFYQRRGRTHLAGAAGRELSKSSRGDTIVEVLIAMAVISFVLLISYAASSRSTNSVRDGQERQEALSLASSQVELLRSSGGLDVNGAGYKCYDSNGMPSATASACKYGADDTPNCVETTNGYCYNVTISDEVSGSMIGPTIANKYTVTITWDNLSGGGDTLTLYYGVQVINPAYHPTDDGSPAVTIGCSTPFLKTLPVCNKPTPPPNPTPDPPSYHYVRYPINANVQIPNDQIVGCDWDFGDGQSSPPGNTEGCHLGETIKHVYSNAGEQPYPADCPASLGAPKHLYNITVKERLKGGTITKASPPVQVDEPQCY